MSGNREAIEAAAKAICDTRHYPDQEAWINMPDDIKEIYRTQARAALDAATVVEAKAAVRRLGAGEQGKKA